MLESIARNYSRNVFIVTVFDCCFQQLKVESSLDLGQNDKKEKENIFCIFGCNPKDGVTVKSPIVEGIVKCTRKWLRQNGGYLVIPDCVDISLLKDYVPKLQLTDGFDQKLVYQIPDYANDGDDSTEEIVDKKHVLVLGEIGVGKSTLMTSLFHSNFDVKIDQNENPFVASLSNEGFTQKLELFQRM